MSVQKAKKRGKKDVRKLVLKITDGVLATAVDLTIFLALWGFDVIYAISPAAKGRPIFGESEWIFEALEQINYRTIKCAVNNARKKGWLQKAGQGKIVEAKITEAGKKRLMAKIPFYDEERLWDGILYLVTYDVPEQKKIEREIFREKLIKIGCGMLQKSVWLTPYNPQEVLDDFIQKRKLKGAVIISSVGRDGSIGDENIAELVYKVYRLGELNKQYHWFIRDFKDKKKDSVKAVFAYLSILNGDPQLPFELLPDDWLGDKAYFLYCFYLRQLSNLKRM